MLFAGPLIPLFLDLMFALGFKARVDSLAWVLRCLHTMVSSDSSPVRHLLTSCVFSLIFVVRLYEYYTLQEELSHLYDP